MAAAWERSAPDPSGEPAGLRGRARRIEADRKRYADLYEHAPVGYLTLDRRTRVSEVNQEALRLFGVERESILGVPLDLRVAGGSRAALRAHLDEVLSSGERRSCRLFFERVAGVPSFVGQLESMAVTDERGHRLCRTALIDVTARWCEEQTRSNRLHEEETAREEAESVRRLFDSVAMSSTGLAELLDLETAVDHAARVPVPHLATYCAIDLLDADGRVRRASFARAGGKTADLPLDPYAPRGSALVVRTGRMEIFTGVSIGDVLALSADPTDLQALWAEVRSFVCLPLRAHGQTIGAMALARSGGPPFGSKDLALAEEVAQHIALAIDNARLYRALKDADRRKDEFLAMLAHELRNPLAAIVFAAEMMRKAADATPLARRTGDVVARQSARLSRLVDDLLDVSRITRGKITLQRERVALGDVVARAVESTRPLFEARRHALSIDEPREAIVLDADPTRLEQIVTNLLANAAKYTEPGGRVHLRVLRGERDAIVRVRDTGIGIAKEMLPLVFVPFTQLDAPPDRTDRGLGIGLTLARSLVEMHGGRISAHSDGPNKGSEFVVRLPLPPAAAAPGPAPDGPLSRPATRRRVLVVEDNADVSAMLREHLEAEGHEVRTADDGPEAIGIALDFRPDLLLIDIGLPGMTGYELAQRLREEPTLAKARLVALTGYGGPDTVRRCLDAGFERHFTKPIQEDALRDLLGAA